jgi:KDO2-lipid IV(A) lauroyltransferase
LKHWIEYIVLRLFLAVLYILPYGTARKLASAIFAIIGTSLSKNRIAIRHIRAALNVDEQQAKKISTNMWKNLGSIASEFPRLQTITKHYVEFKGGEYLEMLRNDGQAGILFGAHIGNWEVIPHAILYHYNLAVHPVYRAPNNPFVDRKLHKYRNPTNQIVPYSKSKTGMAGMVKALRNREHLGLLVDQKLNEGVDAQFFNMRAKTGVAFIDMAKKFDCPLVPVRCIRKNDGFIIEALPPIETQNRDTSDILNDAHSILENWIKEHPEQWLWLHRRWKKEDLKYDHTL